MKQLINVFLLTFIASPLLAQVNTATLEYWFDRNIASRQTVAINGSVVQELDVSNMCYGIHTLEMRVSDTNGRWSSPMLKFFVRNDPAPAMSVIDKYEYWIDDYANVQRGAVVNDNMILDIDVASLSKGLHWLMYQMQYNTGRKSPPRLLYFVIPDLESGADMIAAYEYWFNHSPRTRVEVQPASPTINLNNVIIEVKNIVPNTVEGYRFDASTEQAEVDDNVFFGIQVYTDGGQGSQAVQSETFLMTVPINLNMKVLAKNGEPLTVPAPTTGQMQGMKSETAVGDSLFYVLSLENVMADFYDAVGNQLEAECEVTETGQTIYTLKAASACTYMLVYGASEVQTELTATLVTKKAAGIGSIWSDEAQEVIRYNASGQVIGSHQRGVNIVRMSDGTVRKIIVK